MRLTTSCFSSPSTRSTYEKDHVDTAQRCSTCTVPQCIPVYAARPGIHALVTRALHELGVVTAP